jgi:GNAT superfamily N-acetyltransferase
MIMNKVQKLCQDIEKSYPLVEFRIDCKNNILDLLSITVKPEFQRQGIGTAIIEELIDWCKGNGVKEIMLMSSPKARPFYEKLGFTKRWRGSSLYGLKINS